MATESLLVWGASLAVAATIFFRYTREFRRRVHHDEERKAEAARLGIDRPTAQYPYIDATLCIGCGACVAACPEGDVLGVVGGTATVINGLRCIGHGHCEKECPVGAIEVGLGDVKSRPDLPALAADHESSVPGVYVVGEATGLALIRFAVEQGRRAIAAVDTGLNGSRGEDGVADVLIVGAGPAGLSAALEARARGLSAVVLEQESDLGGSILHYPRRKLVLTQPVPLPMSEALSREEYVKEDLVEMFQRWVKQHELPVYFGQRVTDIDCEGGGFRVSASNGTWRAQRVILAIGRRGTPRRLEVPGEDRAEVMYRLVDAESYRDADILVVGGGDSAVEAAIGLAREGRNRVTLSYRREQLVRIKRKNQERIEALIGQGKVRALLPSEVREIRDGETELMVGDTVTRIPSDYVFVMIGGTPPTRFFERVGVQLGGAGASATGTAARA